VLGGSGYGRVLAGVVAILATLGLAACGDTPDDDRPLGLSISAAVNDLQDAFASEDIEDICTLMTRSAHRQAGNLAHSDPTTCLRDVEKVIETIDKNGGWDGSEAPRVEAVTGSGTRRTVTVAADNGWRTRVPFEKVGRRWKLDGFLGTSPRLLKTAPIAARRKPFPAASGAGVTAVDATDGTCPAVSVAKFPQVRGGCLIKASSKSEPIRMLTPFGDFKFSDCSVDFDIRVGGDGRTWTEKWVIEGPSETGCSDINQCFTPSTYDNQPWKGRLRSDGRGGYLHHIDICLNTCVGLFVGEFVMRLERNAEGWRMRPTERGTTGFLIDGELEVAARDGLDLRAAG
jgi:hypothetical protein